MWQTSNPILEKQIIRMENQHENKNDNSHYFILIPSEVLRMSELSEGAKLLFGEILFLSKKENYCYANNDYFMRLNGVSKRTIVSRLKELKDHKLIRTEVFRNKNQQVEKRNIYVLQNYSNRNVTVENNRQMADGKDNKKLTLGEHQNVFLTESELENLHQKFGKQLFDAELPNYSTWKKNNNANPHSDFETFEKWLSNKKESYKKTSTAVIETGMDEVTQETLENLPF